MASSEFRKAFPADTTIFSLGDKADSAYIVEKGRVEVSIEKDNKKLVVAILTEGDLLGEMALIDDHDRTATAITIEDSELIVIPNKFIKQKIDETDPTVRLFLHVIMERYRDMHARLMHVVEGLTHSDEEDGYQTLFENTSNVVNQLITQYVEMQERIMDAVNTESQFHGSHELEAKTTTHSLNIQHSLRSAIDNKEFELFYQPIIDLSLDKIVGCEALIRWNHPELGLVPPNEFIPIAESTGLIVPLGQWITEEACNALTRFLPVVEQKDDRFFYISINLSAKQFEEDNLIEDIKSTIDKLAIDSSRVKFEITETLLMSNPELAEKALNNLKQLGVTLAIDDFGTGYSSFSYLHRFPIDTLKIDRAFVSTMCENKKSLEIVQSLAQLAHNLGMNVIAEGIETAEERDLLKDFDSDYGQGFYFSRPVPEKEIIELLK